MRQRRILKPRSSRTKVLLTAAAASLLTAVVLQVDSGSASTARNYTLRRGDFVEIPALHWTCTVSRYRPISRYPVLDCNKDVPISSTIDPNVWVSRNNVFVQNTGSRPVRRDRGYVFRY